MKHVASCPGPCVLVLVVYLKIKKNKFLKKQVVVLPVCCVFLHMVGVSPVELHLVCCVFLLVS
mgnify:CR=1 FL=1